MRQPNSCGVYQADADQRLRTTLDATVVVGQEDRTHFFKGASLDVQLNEKLNSITQGPNAHGFEIREAELV